MTKALIADDHSLFRKGLAYALTDLLDVQTVLEASSLDEALDHLNAERGIDIVFLDIGMPGVAGMESIRAFVDGHPTVPVVIISAHEERQVILESLGVGVRGYIPKSLDEEAIAHALRAIIAGDIYVPRSIADQVASASSADQPANAKQPLTLDALTPRQRDVLDLLAKGRSNKEIARALDIAEG
jgi:DNA-binding NarL/FixJ family response regulator